VVNNRVKRRGSGSDNKIKDMMVAMNVTQTIQKDIIVNEMFESMREQINLMKSS